MFRRPFGYALLLGGLVSAVPSFSVVLLLMLGAFVGSSGHFNLTRLGVSVALTAFLLLGSRRLLAHA
jgi:hypothetical protein